jgi:hypothetical protein
VNVHRRLWCPRTVDETHKGICGIRLGRLELAGPACLVEEFFTADTNNRQQGRRIIGGEARLEPDGSVAVVPVTQVTTTTDSFGCVLVPNRCSSHVATTLPERSDAFRCSERKERLFSRAIRDRGGTDLLGLCHRQPSGEERLPHCRQLLQTLDRVQRCRRVPEGCTHPVCHPGRER